MAPSRPGTGIQLLCVLWLLCSSCQQQRVFDVSEDDDSSECDDDSSQDDDDSAEC